MTKREKVRELMTIKRYFHCVEKRLKCLEPILPYLETSEGIKTPLMVGGEIRLEEITERMVDLYENYWEEAEVDEMLVFFTRPVGQKLIASGEELAAKLCAVLDDYLMEKMTDFKRNRLH